MCAADAHDEGTPVDQSAMSLSAALSQQQQAALLQMMPVVPLSEIPLPSQPPGAPAGVYIYASRSGTGVFAQGPLSQGYTYVPIAPGGTYAYIHSLTLQTHSISFISSSG